MVGQDRRIPNIYDPGVVNADIVTDATRSHLGEHKHLFGSSEDTQLMCM